MQEQHTNFSLKSFNTFHIEAFAHLFCRFHSIPELREWLQSKKNTRLHDLLVLGGGSNLLFTRDYSGTVIQPLIKGIEIVGEEGDEVLVKFGAGEEWDRCVAWAVENGLGGIENLSHIPGMCGAAPIQNIGAYGVELKDVMECTRGLWIESGETFELNNDQCDFNYRYSVFKGPLKNKTVITSVVLRLKKKPHHQLSYGALGGAVERRGGPSLKNIREAVIEIRESKLPNPEETGNGGSFFKNPVIDAPRYRAMQQTWPQLPGYFLPDGESVKVPAGWLIEHTGWKGAVRGRAGVHPKQALVLVNLGGAAGSEILALAQAIEADVKQTFEIELEREVNVL